jgi:hypothetical protein
MTEINIFSKEKNNNPEEKENIIGKNESNTSIFIDEKDWEEEKGEGKEKENESEKSINEEIEKDNITDKRENKYKAMPYDNEEEFQSILRSTAEHLSSGHPKPTNPLETECTKSDGCLLIMLIILVIIIALITFLSVKYLNFNDIYNAEKDNIKEYCQIFDLQIYDCQFTIHLNTSICNTTCSCINQEGLEQCFDSPNFTKIEAYILGISLITICILICLLWRLKIRYCSKVNNTVGIYGNLPIA